jgi:hypothetical protein
MQNLYGGPDGMTKFFTIVDTLRNNPVDKGEAKTSYPTTGLDRH